MASSGFFQQLQWNFINTHTTHLLPSFVETRMYFPVFFSGYHRTSLSIVEYKSLWGSDFRSVSFKISKTILNRNRKSSKWSSSLCCSLSSALPLLHRNSALVDLNSAEARLTLVLRRKVSSKNSSLWILDEGSCGGVLKFLWEVHKTLIIVSHFDQDFVRYRVH